MRWQGVVGLCYSYVFFHAVSDGRYDLSHPPCTPTAKLYAGSKTLAKRGVNCLRSAIAVIRRIAEGMPSGRSFVVSSGSFS